MAPKAITLRLEMRDGASCYFRWYIQIQNSEAYACFGQFVHYYDEFTSCMKPVGSRMYGCEVRTEHRFSNYNVILRGNSLKSEFMLWRIDPASRI
jgi:hypothetical protein